jgi:transposase-like protein
MGDTWYLDELFVNIQGQPHYLWRAVDEDGDVIDILMQSRRDRRAATRFFRKLLKRQARALPFRSMMNSSCRRATRFSMSPIRCRTSIVETLSVIPTTPSPIIVAIDAIGNGRKMAEWTSSFDS